MIKLAGKQMGHISDIMIINLIEDAHSVKLR